jgi:acyl-CoA synthetase (AMP-forming)/AMP-acid ligase II
MMLIDRFPAQWALNTPAATAAVHLDTTLRYAELEENTARIAGLLRSCGVASGDRVAVLLDNGLDYLCAFFGILRAGGVVVGLNPANTSRDIAYVLGHCRAAAVITQPRSLAALKQALPAVPSVHSIFLSCPPSAKAEQGLPGSVSCCWLYQSPESGPLALSPLQGDDALAAIIYTSGTTGKPKGVMLTHRNLAANTRSIVDYLGLTSGDSVMVVLPFYYSYGLSLLLTHAAVGGRLVIDNRFAYPNTVLETMERERVTGFAGVPSTFAILIHKSSINRFLLSSLRYLTQAGGPMAPALIEEIGRLLPGREVFIMYGQTEAAARLSYLPPDRIGDKLGSIGKAIPDVELKLLDREGRPVAPGGVGEIVARGDNVMAGYWDSPEETAAVLRPEGLRTGDLARMDEDGFLYIVSRKSDMIKSGAHRISPKAIEEIIAEHEGVFESAAVGFPDEILGEAIALFVVPRDGAALTEADVLKHCRNNLPRYKVPQKIILASHLPKTPSGKIRRPLLQEQLAAVHQDGQGDRPGKADQPARG